MDIVDGADAVVELVKDLEAALTIVRAKATKLNLTLKRPRSKLSLQRRTWRRRVESSNSAYRLKLRSGVNAPTPTCSR